MMHAHRSVQPASYELQGLGVLQWPKCLTRWDNIASLDGLEASSYRLVEREKQELPSSYVLLCIARPS